MGERTDADVGLRLLSPTPEARAAAQQAGYPLYDATELDASDPAQVAQFHAAISDAKASLGPSGAPVFIYPAEDYGAMRLFVLADGFCDQERR